MKQLNTLNKIFLGLTILLAALLVHKIVKYKAWERFYYFGSVSNPKEYPIRILDVNFIGENGETISRSFYHDVEDINSFYSRWGSSDYYTALDPEFLPNRLRVEYIDFRTKNYYKDTINLPKEKMIDLFNNAKQKGLTKIVNLWGSKQGLEIHVGVANDGHLIFWMIGKKYETEFYRVQIHPKPLPSIIYNRKIDNKQAYYDELFEEMEDSIKTKLLNDNLKAQYKDSIPIYFDNLQ